MYKHILLATDLSTETKKVIKKAKDLAEKLHAKLSIIHILDYNPLAMSGSESIASGMSIDAELMNTMEQQTRKKLNALAKLLNIKQDRCYIEYGSIKHTVVEKAEKIKADLIVIGSHGRHGPALLLGSSANAILHVAKCDVLAVRV